LGFVLFCVICGFGFGFIFGFGFGFSFNFVLTVSFKFWFWIGFQLDSLFSSFFNIYIS
jgi:hypothetical protein